jgi:hypothetical protein
MYGAGSSTSRGRMSRHGRRVKVLKRKSEALPVRRKRKMNYRILP